MREELVREDGQKESNKRLESRIGGSAEELDASGLQGFFVDTVSTSSNSLEVRALLFQ